MECMFYSNIITEYGIDIYEQYSEDLCASKQNKIWSHREYCTRQECFQSLVQLLKAAKVVETTWCMYVYICMYVSKWIGVTFEFRRSKCTYACMYVRTYMYES